MELQEELLKAVRRTAGSLPGVSSADRGEVEGQAYLRLAGHLFGGRLVSVVQEAARDFYAAEGRRPGFLLGPDLARRLLGLARVVAPRPADAPAVAALAEERLRALIEGPFVAAAVRNVAKDILKKNGREILPTPGDGQSQEDVLADMAALQPAPPPAGLLPPRFVLEERLRLLFRSGSPLHEAIVYGYRTHLGRSAVAIVGELAMLPLCELYGSLVSVYAERARISRDRVEELLGGPAGVGAYPGSNARLCDLWDPLAVVQSWIQSVGAHVDPGANLAELAAVHKAAPNRRLVYLYSHHAEYAPARVVAELGALTLEELFVEFEARYRHEHQISSQELRERFGAMLKVEKSAAKETLGSYFAPYRTVSDWVYNVGRRIKNAGWKQAQDGLGLITALPGCAASELVVFFFAHCLGRGIADLVREFGAAPFGEMEKALEVAFKAHWGAETEEAKFHLWFRPLRVRLLAGLADTALRDLVGGGAAAGPAVMAMWRDKVLRLALPLFRGGQLPLFAYEHNLFQSRGDEAI